MSRNFSNISMNEPEHSYASQNEHCGLQEFEDRYEPQHPIMG